MRPVIGITCDLQESDRASRCGVNTAYADAVFAAGGLPVLLPPPPEPSPALFDEFVARCDALLFTGGPDLHPRHYGQTLHPQTRVLPERRDRVDIELFKHVQQAGRPTLAICLGCQIANVACGGALVQHVDDLPRAAAVRHFSADRSSVFHAVRIEPDSRLAKIVGRTEMEVNSRHHQVVDRSQVGGRLRPVAFAPDGVVEAAEDFDGRFLIAVQWHPEDLIDRPEHLRLFEALVGAARSTNRSKVQ